MKIGLFFGSFNPVHIGHMLIANYMTSFTDLDKLWFIVSPQNPLKNKELLLDDKLRLRMLEIAVGRHPVISVSDVESGLSKPSFTINTLNHLNEKHPEHTFVIIMGADGLSGFTEWKEYQYIERHYQRYIYPRPGFESMNPISCINCLFQPAPLIDISSTFIRQALKERKDMRYYLPEGVFDFIKENSLYI